MATTPSTRALCEATCVVDRAIASWRARDGAIDDAQRRASRACETLAAPFVEARATGEDASRDASEAQRAVKALEKHHARLRALADARVKLAQATYDAVDDHITRLDKDLATFERERGSAHRAGERTKFDLALAGEHGFEALTNAPSASPGSALASPGNPNEPRYCVCRSVSDGKMIGCDNDDCAIEWFHFACVGLNPNAEVKGKWICPPCRRKKR